MASDLLSGTAPSDGAFYIYVDLSASGAEDSSQLCYRILEEAGVAITPGVDFEDPSSGLGRCRIRFSFSRDTAEVREGMRLFKEWSDFKLQRVIYLFWFSYLLLCPNSNVPT